MLLQSWKGERFGKVSEDNGPLTGRHWYVRYNGCCFLGIGMSLLSALCLFIIIIVVVVALVLLLGWSNREPDDQGSTVGLCGSVEGWQVDGRNSSNNGAQKAPHAQTAGVCVCVCMPKPLLAGYLGFPSIGGTECWSDLMGRLCEHRGCGLCCQNVKELSLRSSKWVNEFN